MREVALTAPVDELVQAAQRQAEERPELGDGLAPAVEQQQAVEHLKLEDEPVPAAEQLKLEDGPVPAAEQQQAAERLEQEDEPAPVAAQQQVAENQSPDGGQAYPA